MFRVIISREVEELIPKDLLKRPSGQRSTSKYTREVVAPLLQAVYEGASPAVASGIAGISPSVISTWCANQCAGFKPQFLLALNRCRALCIHRFAKKIEASEDWRAAAFWLERRTVDYKKDAEIVVNNDNSKTEIVVGSDLLKKLQESHSRLFGEKTAYEKN